MTSAVTPCGVPVDPALFASLDPPRLAGARCGNCATTVFPVAAACPRCSADGPAMAPVALPGHGTIWTLTGQDFEPKPPYTPPPDGFQPYAVGYVDLGDVLVESLLAGDPAALDIGVRVRLTLVRTGAAGEVTYAFEPAEPAGEKEPGA
ncbi:Zn-ribbon domain-containing OB-fold protein [Frankia sp. CiP3]|uniref:Zn-ribbon domain-containing OB-fold protein n=1 Tax=Frankia sp. CiP3 TaxID=2880971 RepID=UPI001EF4E13B|nr:OB-fold domain-containing protein [Frankia sp. CiP3]